MQNSSIDYLDRARYKMVKWFTIGWAIWFGTFILKDYLSEKWFVFSVILIGLIAWVMFVVQHLRIMKLGKIFKTNPRIKDALNDELMQHNRNKAAMVSYKVIMIFITIFLLFSLYTEVTALLVSEILLYVGVLSPLITSLVLNKR